MDLEPREIRLKEINGGVRYVEDDEVSPEAINAPLEASAYAQARANEAITKADEALGMVEDSIMGKLTISAYPIGSIYMSVGETSPAELFGGGTWEKIEGRFLMGSGTPTINTTSKYGAMNGAGYSFAVGEKGGQFKHTLTIEEMPSHNHNIDRPKWYAVDTEGTTNIYGTTGNFTMKVTDTTTTTIKNKGGGQMHNVLNPYYTVNMWKRIA
jgi:hypothetical protein